MNILVLSGGVSNERDISIKSANNVRDALVISGHNVHFVDPSDKNFNILKYKNNIDLVMPILHGAGGEDGTIQSYLDTHGLKYLGSDSKSSKIAFDKDLYKQEIKKRGILTGDWEKVNKNSYRNSSLYKKQHVVKPISGGSSIDTILVRNPEDIAKAETALAKYDEMLIEELIDGNEITVAILGDKALPIILITPPDGKDFDFTNKYNGKSKEIVNPQNISKQIGDKAQLIAENIHELLNLRHISRTDMIIDKDGNIYVLETNTMPGLTTNSLYPKAALAAGYPMPKLVEELMYLAY